jgi:hypothetical protein
MARMVVVRGSSRMAREEPPGEPSPSAEGWFGVEPSGVARLCGNVRQPDHVLADSIAGHEAQRRPRAGEERLAATQHDGMEVQSILVDEAKVGQTSRELGSGNFNLPIALSL